MSIGQAAGRLEARPETARQTTVSARQKALRWEALEGYGFLLPALVLLLLFHVLPVFYALFLSLYDARVFKDMWHPGPFAAAGNYGRLFSNGDFGQSLTNTLWFAGITVPLG